MAALKEEKLRCYILEIEVEKWEIKKCY